VKRPLRLDHEAEQEIEATWRWYEARQPGLGDEFLAAIEEALLRLEGATAAMSVPGVPRGLGARRVLVRKFPYSVVFIDLPTERRVLAIAHGKRKPGYWRKRRRRYD